MPLDLASFESAAARVDLSYKLRNSGDPVVELKQVVLRLDQPFSHRDLTISTTIQHHDGKPLPSGRLLNISITALKPIELVHFEAKYLLDLKGQRMLANGFQSWSQAREYEAHDRIPAIRSSVAYWTQYNLQGDYDFFPHSGEKGHIHSSSYTHFRDVQNNVRFFGSLSEHLGYTYFKADFNQNTLGIYKDILGKHIDANQSIELVRVLLAEGKDAERSLWDLYATFFPDRRALHGDMHHLRHVNGWTSWYNYYGDVSESIVLENLEALQKHQYPINIFQIDDGFQTAIGDWLSINDKFPNGLKSVASKINAAGFTPGLWLAPYAVAFTSKLAADHPDWLIQDPTTGKPIVAGPNWGGFYGLDMYHPEARAYLKQVFDTVLREWGFGMVKLDFLFAAAMIPRLGRSRGEIMWDAMQFVRDLAGPDKLVLGCGVPLACAWRNADYCRIGSDVAPWWEDSKLKYLHVRERVSTANSLRSTLSRWPMSDRMFGNDPDVMILRDNKNKLNLEERYTLCVLNNILGALVFSSDNVNEYGEDEHLLYKATFPKVIALVDRVIEFQPGVFTIQFKANDLNGVAREYTTIANLSRDDKTVYLPPSSNTTHLLFAADNEIHTSRFGTNGSSSSLSSWREKSIPLFYHPSSTINIKSHETKTFMHIPPPQSSGVLFLGSTSHIVPGAEIEHLSCKDDSSVDIRFHKQNTRKHTVYLAMGDYLFGAKTPAAPVPSCTVNGQKPKFEMIQVMGSGEGRPPSKVLVAVVSDNA